MTTLSYYDKKLSRSGGIGPILLITVFIISLVALFALLKGKVSFLNFASIQPSGEVVRGLPNDFWADRVIGKKDFGEISPNMILPNKVFRPGGTVVDTQTTKPGILYVWDGGNNRILGIDLAKCYSSDKACSADIVLGQPAGSDMGGCNNDSSFTKSPNRKPASASSLCGLPEDTHTTLEDKSLITMYVDKEGSLYVPDAFNHRILKYQSPIKNGSFAVEVWGQPDFLSNGCNVTGGTRSGLSGGKAPQPTANSLCFHSVEGEGAAVTFDSKGNMWVADGGNNRILRYSKSGTQISKTPDLVLGQPNFNTGGDWSGGDKSGTETQFRSPQSIAFDKADTLYVSDSGNGRVLKLPAPYVKSSVILKDLPGGIITLVNDPQDRGFWTRSNEINSIVSLWNYDGQALTSMKVNNYGAGAFGFDSNNHILVPTYDDQDVFEMIPDASGLNYREGKSIFLGRNAPNSPSPDRFYHPAWGGIAVTNNQLIVAVNHLRFWNNPPNIPNGKAPDGFVGVDDDNTNASPEFGQLSYDQNDVLWVARNDRVEAYKTPLTPKAQPVKTINLVKVLGGGFQSLNDVLGVAATSQSKFLWVSENANSRILRLKNPLTDPTIDVVIGQDSINGLNCNRNLTPARSNKVDLTMICNPGALSLDRKNNLYVSDHAVEAEGNFRTLLFSADTFPDNLTQVLFLPKAVKEFPKQGVSQDWSHMSFQAAFDSTNRMVVGNNPYSGYKKRFLEYYNDPLKVNPSNPSDPKFAEPDGNLNDFYGWPIGMVFDTADNLYVYDANRGQVRIYFNPFNSSPTNKPPVADFTLAPTSGYSPLTVSFDGSKSTDPENEPLKYEWDFGDGQKSDVVKPINTYKLIGTPLDPPKVYTISLVVTDPKGARSKKITKKVTVNPNRPPVAKFTYKVLTGSGKYTVLFDASSSSNPDNDGMAYRWNYGDGKTEKTKINTHVYQKPGKYEVTLKVRDRYNAESAIRKVITLN